jgi:hypothetical protein
MGLEESAFNVFIPGCCSADRICGLVSNDTSVSLTGIYRFETMSQTDPDNRNHKYGPDYPINV